MNPCSIVSIGSFIIGLIVNAVVLFSLPFIPGAGIYIASVSIGAPLIPIEGTLNGVFTYQNLTSLRLGNWAVCLFDNQTFVEAHGILCTKFAVGYSVTLTSANTNTTPAANTRRATILGDRDLPNSTTVNGTELTNSTTTNSTTPSNSTTNGTTNNDNSTVTIVQSLWTIPLVIHLAAFIFYVVAIFPTGKIMWTYIAVGVNVAATVADFALYGFVVNRVGSDKTSLGPSPAAALVSTAILIVGIVTRAYS